MVSQPFCIFNILYNWTRNNWVTWVTQLLQILTLQSKLLFVIEKFMKFSMYNVNHDFHQSNLSCPAANNMYIHSNETIFEIFEATEGPSYL